MNYKNFFVFFLFVILTTSCEKQTIPSAPSQIVMDNKYHFEIYLPKDWQLSRIDKKDSFFRFSAISADESEGFFVYAVETKIGTFVEKAKLIDNIESTFKIGSKIKDPMDKFYDEKTNIYTTVLTKTDRNYGYYILYKSVKKDLGDRGSFLFSAKTSAPFEVWKLTILIIKILLSYIIVPGIFAIIGAYMGDRKLKKRWPIIGGIITPIIALPIVLYLGCFNSTGYLIFTIVSPFFMIGGYYGVMIYFEEN